MGVMAFLVCNICCSIGISQRIGNSHGIGISCGIGLVCGVGIGPTMKNEGLLA